MIWRACTPSSDEWTAALSSCDRCVPVAGLKMLRHLAIDRGRPASCTCSSRDRLCAACWIESARLSCAGLGAVLNAVFTDTRCLLLVFRGLQCLPLFCSFGFCAIVSTAHCAASRQQPCTARSLRLLCSPLQCSWDATIVSAAHRLTHGLVLMQSLGDHLRETGRQLVLDPERTKDPVEFVERLLAEKEKYDRCA